MNQHKSPESAWNEFTDTGRLDAYLTYRALQRAKERTDRV